MFPAAYILNETKKSTSKEPNKYATIQGRQLLDRIMEYENKKRDALNRDLDHLEARYGISFSEAEREDFARRASVSVGAFDQGMAVSDIAKSAAATLSEAQIKSLWSRKRYRDRPDETETAERFVRRVYKDLINKGLKLSDFRLKSPIDNEMLDEPLYRALSKLDYSTRESLGLLTKSEKTDILAAKAQLNPEEFSAEARARLSIATGRRLARSLGLKA